MDGVLANTPDMIYKHLKEHGYEITNNEYHAKLKGCDGKEIVMDFINDLFTNRMDEVGENKEYQENVMKEIDIVADVTIVTARRPKFCEGTRDWLTKHFPDTKMDLIFLSSSDKPSFVKEHGFHAFVEDRLRTANTAARMGINTYLMTHPWNMGRPIHEKVTRINSLSTFQSLLATVSHKFTNKNDCDIIEKQHTLC